MKFKYVKVIKAQVGGTDLYDIYPIIKEAQALGINKEFISNCIGKGSVENDSLGVEKLCLTIEKRKKSI